MKEIRESFNTVDVNRLSLVSDEMLRLFPDTDKFGGAVDRKCMDSVELSNVCREFYKVRQQAAADVKAKLCSPIRHMEASPSTPSKIDVAMETLKSEMVRGFYRFYAKFFKVNFITSSFPLNIF